MKRLLTILAIPTLMLGACQKDITSLNVDPKNPQVVTGVSLFTGAQKATIDMLSSTNVNDNNFRLVTQQWQETTYLDESNYNFLARAIPDALWDDLYLNIKNFADASTSLTHDVTVNVFPKEDLPGALAVVDLMAVQNWYYLVTTYGNVPYTNALNSDNTLPKYDDAMTIYKDLLKRIDEDITHLDGNTIGSADLIYSGDASKWKAFANSLKLKLALTLADADNATAKAAAESAAAAVFKSNADNAYYPYEKTSPNNNPIWADLVQSGRNDFVACETLVGVMRELKDPRMAYYFSLADDSTTYKGGSPGKSSKYDVLTKPAADKFRQPDFKGVFMTYAEVQFLLAESAERGYNVGGLAADFYGKAITASIEQWGGVDSLAVKYLAQPSVNYLKATGDWKEKIGTQKWIAMYNQGWDSWVDIRLLDFPKLPAPAAALSTFPTRLTYPNKEQNVNKANYEQAMAAQGGGTVTNKLFFDKF